MPSTMTGAAVSIRNTCPDAHFLAPGVELFKQAQRHLGASAQDGIAGRPEPPSAPQQAGTTVCASNDEGATIRPHAIRRKYIFTSPYSV